MFTKCGITLSTPQVRQIIAYCDADRNGQVSLKELKWLLLNPDTYDAEFNDPPDLKRWLQKEFQPVAAEPEQWKKFLIVLYKSLAPVRSIRTPPARLVARLVSAHPEENAAVTDRQDYSSALPHADSSRQLLRRPESVGRAEAESAFRQSPCALATAVSVCVLLLILYMYWCFRSASIPPRCLPLRARSPTTLAPGRTRQMMPRAPAQTVMGWRAASTLMKMHARFRPEHAPLWRLRPSKPRVRVVIIHGRPPCARPPRTARARAQRRTKSPARPLELARSLRLARTRTPTRPRA